MPSQRAWWCSRRTSASTASSATNALEQEIIVEVSGQIIEGGLQQLNQINGKVSWQNETRLRFAMKNAKLALIEKLCKEVGLRVVAMKRIRIGRISMSSLPAGEWRYLQDTKVLITARQLGTG
jgi:23S rRNA pseudouridine2604 synthase